ncbi:hypothetical protein PpBr36_01366 [Pyricularia pennisetigena]|uniref:hypothetical protein n=1 Tax=Pyricularia pennisetigena TaxID=1578925 RepID=UPI00114F60A5|nr:hypothetical protein PpBr36_01366 [Pyricularia pennisetigena]TLS29466.1 hypothetical protein PpBr36_01366 [Pyricularia pennisetigena]
METSRKDSDSSSSGRCTSCAATRGSSITEWHIGDYAGAPDPTMPASTRPREGCNSPIVLQQPEHASGQVSYSSRLHQVDASGTGSIAELPSSGLQAEPQHPDVHLRAESPAPISQLQNQTGQQMGHEALKYENPRICGRRTPSAQLVSFCGDVEREDPRFVVARAAEVFPDVPDNVSEPDQDDIYPWEQHYRWDHPRASDAGPAAAGDLWWEAVSPLSRSPSPGYGHFRSSQ